ncbi:MAG: TIM barrel protein, partial [Lacunisphaera sp.]
MKASPSATPSLKPAPAPTWGMKKLSMYADEVYPASAGFEPALALLQRLGIEHIDLRRVNGVDSLINASAADLDAARRLLKKYGIKVAGLGTPLFKCPLRGVQGPVWGGHHGIGARIGYERYMDLLPRTFTLADQFGTNNIRVFAFWRQHNLDEVFDEVVDKLGRAAEVARKAGHKLFLENEHNCIVGTGVEQGRLLKAINSPSLVGIYDEGNSARIGGVIADDYAAMRGWIGHVHMKHRRLDVTCGWMSPHQQLLDQKSGGYRPYFLWRQPKAPFTGQIRYGNKTFELHGQRTTENVTHSVVDHFRPLLQNLKDDGYDGVIAVDNAWDGLRSRMPVAELDPVVNEGMRAFGQLIEEVWDAPPAARN